MIKQLRLLFKRVDENQVHMSLLSIAYKKYLVKMLENQDIAVGYYVCS